ncbi:hypothetical protein UY3_16094 [Chelonia mydas]|uniref:Uncharacterized protein n=1 Tax=Chelonia mydas TaxID=8469 RepID=M7AV25_CHEMY|nr:hypothetical protein UY3_16094 [Chelonia mydas]
MQDSTQEALAPADTHDVHEKPSLHLQLPTDRGSKEGDGIKFRGLHPACQGGDHYMSDKMNPPPHPNIYTIKGESYRVVKDLSTDAESKPECCKGLYYFDFSVFPALIEVFRNGGTQCYRYNDMSSTDSVSFSIHPNVQNFLPGGLTLTTGISTGAWKCIKNLHNDSESPSPGQTRSPARWATPSTICPASSTAGGSLLRCPSGLKLSTQVQFSLRAKYSGRSVCTEQEDWNEAQEEEESAQGGDLYGSDKTIPPHNIYIIKGDSYQVVKDFSTDAEAKVHKLHPNCCGRDHYMHCASGFHIIFREQRVVCSVLDMGTDEHGMDAPLHPECCKGLYYFFPTVLKVDEKWWVELMFIYT